MRDRLPFEDLDNGLYLHDRDDLLLLRMRNGKNVSYYLPVEQFMELQKERDNYRRTLGLINACRGNPTVSILPPVVVNLLEDAGFDEGQARATAGIIREVLEHHG